jgi:hypothetical protein
MSSPPEARYGKRLQSQQHVSACVNDFEIDENGKATKKRRGYLVMLSKLLVTNGMK